MGLKQDPAAGELIRYELSKHMKKLSPSDHARRFEVGNQILEGPRSIFPPREIADYGWLEPSLLIILRKIDLIIFESIALFCDDSVNRESDFLSPMVRHMVSITIFVIG